MNLVTVKSTQTVIDIALQMYGDADRAFDVVDSLELENIESDPTGEDFEPEKNSVTNYYLSKNISVNNKPMRYANSNQGALIVSPGVYLVQNNKYKILI